jgi:hypothetical protein
MMKINKNLVLNEYQLNKCDFYLTAFSVAFPLDFFILSLTFGMIILQHLLFDHDTYHFNKSSFLRD